MNLKITRSILIGGEIKRPGSIIKTTAHHASDLLARGCAVLHLVADTEPAPVDKPVKLKAKKNAPEHQATASEAKNAGAPL